MNEFMKIANEEAKIGMNKGHGGPFGAVIVKDGKIIAKTHNMVIKNKDSTCHAEIQAIRMASKKLKRFDLSDCEIYSSCEPCPMCFAAIHWAKIKKLYYSATRNDAAKIGFDDKFIYNILSGKTNIDNLEIEIVKSKEIKDMMKEWNNLIDHKNY